MQTHRCMQTHTYTRTHTHARAKLLATEFNIPSNRVCNHLTIQICTRVINTRNNKQTSNYTAGKQCPLLQYTSGIAPLKTVQTEDDSGRGPTWWRRGRACALGGWGRRRRWRRPGCLRDERTHYFSHSAGSLPPPLVRDRRIYERRRTRGNRKLARNSAA